MPRLCPLLLDQTEVAALASALREQLGPLAMMMDTFEQAPEEARRR